MGPPFRLLHRIIVCTTCKTQLPNRRSSRRPSAETSVHDRLPRPACTCSLSLLRPTRSRRDRHRRCELQPPDAKMTFLGWRGAPIGSEGLTFEEQERERSGCAGSPEGG